jgi:hypothetical protein
MALSKFTRCSRLLDNAAARIHGSLPSASNSSPNGYVLEVSAPNISGGDFLDITKVGGTFVTGGYTCTIGGPGHHNPLAGRMAWSGNTNGYIDVINLGPNLAGQTVTFRFRMGTDEAVAWPGVHIDNLVFTGASCP